VDVLVIGGGIIGVATAGELARRGARVTLVEARELGRGATKASAGMLAPFTEAEPGTVLSELCAEGLAVYDEAVARVRREIASVPGHRDFEYARTGTLEVALDEASASHFRASESALRARGVDAAWLDAPATMAAAPAVSRAAFGSLLIPAHGFVAVTPFVDALATAARVHGVDFVRGARVDRVRRTANGFDVSTDLRQHQADVVVVAGGSWSGQLTIDGEAPLPVHPVRGQLLELRPRTPLMTRIVWGPRCYLVPWADGAVLVGATVEEVGFDERVTVDGVRQLMTAGSELVPALADASFVEARVGLRPASSDALPIVGPSVDVPGLVHATGHYRNGVLLAPLTASIVADLVLDDRRHPALDTIGPARFARAVR
jgi:glycine oxidase